MTDTNLLAWRLLRLRPAGFFSNVNEVIQQVHLARCGGYKFVIEWRSSAYSDPSRSEDPWEYYFEPPFIGFDGSRDDLAILPGGVDVACTRDNIITPRLRDGDCDSLLLPADRNMAFRIISAYIRLKPSVGQFIEECRVRMLDGKTIGLHVRGPGRLHGGVDRLRAQLPTEGGVPFSTYFSNLDQALDHLPDARVFMASDSEFVVRRFNNRYGSRIYTLPTQRSEFGEMHVRGCAENIGMEFDTYRLGLEVLTEAWILASTDVLVHGNSNVSNFILCLNPLLENIYVEA